MRFEPAFIQAIDFAIGNGLVERVGGDKLQLLQRGRDLADAVIADSDLLVTEKEFLSGIKSLVAEARIREVVYRER